MARRTPSAAVAALLLFIPIDMARALPVSGLGQANSLWAAGDYAPAGDCRREPKITAAANGFAFTVNGQTIRAVRPEWAPDYVRGADSDKVTWFFPFARSDDDLGPILMSLTREGRNVTMELENNSDRPLQAVYGALLAGSPYKRCAATATGVPVAPRALSPPASGTTAPLQWASLPQATSGLGGPTLAGRGDIGVALRALLGPKLPVLEKNLSVSTALTRAGSLYYVSGNADHRGGYDMAYVLLDPRQRAIEVGLWEGGNLAIYRTPGSRIALPPDIQKLRTEQPPEEAVAAPGPPWELRAVPGHTPLAFGTPAASPHLDTMGLYCDSGRPWISVRFYRDPGVPAVTLTMVLMGRTFDAALHPVNGTRTMWIADVSRSSLVKAMIAYTSRDPAFLRINGAMEGEINLTGVAQTARAALATCMRL